MSIKYLGQVLLLLQKLGIHITDLANLALNESLFKVNATLTLSEQIYQQND